MTISVAIQTHPSRAWLVDRLEGELGIGFGEVDVVVDPEPASPLRSPWRTARLAWSRSPTNFTHRLVLQDDVRVCPDFLALADRAIAAHPTELVTFYVGRYPSQAAVAVIQALEARAPFANIGLENWTPCLALAMPTAMALDLASHTDRHHYPEAMCADDGIVSLWRQDRGHTNCWATVPSLVDHDNEPVSLMGSGFMGERIAIVAHPGLPENKNRLGHALDLAF